MSATQAKTEQISSWQSGRDLRDLRAVNSAAESGIAAAQ
jgi:hypothetical protein